MTNMNILLEAINLAREFSLLLLLGEEKKKLSILEKPLST